MEGGACVETRDANQCINGEAKCGPNSTCNDQAKGYSCQCNDGFEENDGMCSLVLDQNQCSVNENVCGPNSVCTDLKIGFECACADGYTMVNGSCQLPVQATTAPTSSRDANQ